MTFGAPGDSRQVVTLVVRLWAIGPPNQSQELRLEATHVQTGDVAYYRTTDGVARHLEQLVKRLAETAAKAPIDLARTARRRNERGYESEISAS
jgi:hypothetical protein